MRKSRGVQKFEPYTISKSIGLALLQETSLESLTRSSNNTEMMENIEKTDDTSIVNKSEPTERIDWNEESTGSELTGDSRGQIQEVFTRKSY